MRFSAISVAVTLALSVNAASLNKRDTSTCISDLTSVDGAVNKLNTFVNNITTGSLDLNIGLGIYGYGTNIKTAVSAAQTSCCSLAAPLSSADASSVLTKESSIASDFTTLSSATVAKKSIFGAKPAYGYLYKWGFGNATEATTPFLDCLTTVLPSGSQSTANGYATTIESALQAVNDEFANVAIPDTVIYSDTQACVNDLNSLNDGLDATAVKLHAFSNTSTTSDFNSLQSLFAKDQSLSQAAAASCCAISHSLDPPEITYVNAPIYSLQSNYVNLTDRAVYAKPWFDLISNADYTLKEDFISLNVTTSQYFGCLQPYAETDIQQYIANSFQIFFNAFASATQS